MTVWTYWEGFRPQYIETCLRSMQQICDAVVVTPETLDDYLPVYSLHPNWSTLQQPALRADCIRAALLATHGGWWWDADTVAITPPPETEAEAVYTTWTRPPVRVLNGYIYIERESKLAAQWLDFINDRLDRDPAGVDWCSLGEGVLTRLMTDEVQAVRMPRETVLPIDIDSDVQAFFSTSDFREYITDGVCCFGLNHSWFVYHRARDVLLPRSKWADSPLLIHQLLHWAEENA